MLKRQKDMAGCVANRKFDIRLFEGRFYHAYLWENQGWMLANTVPDKGEEPNTNSQGMCCHAVQYVILNDGQPACIGAPRRLGELHFIKGVWNLEIAVHECYHATVNITKAMQLPVTEHIMYEERAAYIHGELADAVYRWLWEVDPHGRFRSYDKWSSRMRALRGWLGRWSAYLP